MRICLRHALYLCIVVFILSCTDGKDSNNIQQNNSTAISEINRPAKRLVNMTLSGGHKYNVGKKIEVKVDLSVDSSEVDSVRYLFNNTIVKPLKGESGVIVLDTKAMLPGNYYLVSSLYKDGKVFYTKDLTVKLLAGNTPKQRSFKIVNVFNHDVKSYTQGLLFDKGHMYEGTGMRGRSVLKKLDYESGQVLKEKKLPYEHFGEGVAIVGDSIFQLTWKSQRVHVYNKNSFKEIAVWPYPTVMDGWGLTYDGTSLIMSDGSNTLFYINPKDFTLEKEINIYDDKGPVNQLNELEFVNGLIYANVYQTDNIVIIDPDKASVIELINLKGLLRPEDRHTDIDVLNGIAYLQNEDRLFVTGKNWPKLFEIKLTSVQ